MRMRSRPLTAMAVFAAGIAAGTLAAAGTVAGAEPADPAPTAAAKPIVLRWQARQQRDVYGYIVYRATRREGPYLRASADIVPKRLNGSYVWRDRGLEPGVTYFYYVDAVSTGGLKTRFSGVLQKTAVARRARSARAASAAEPPAAPDQRSGSPVAGSPAEGEQGP